MHKFVKKQVLFNIIQLKTPHKTTISEKYSKKTNRFFVK